MASSTLVKMKISSSYAYMNHNDWLHIDFKFPNLFVRLILVTFSLQFDLKNPSSEAGIGQLVKAFPSLWKAKLLYSLSKKSPPPSGPYHFFFMAQQPPSGPAPHSRGL